MIFNYYNLLILHAENLEEKGDKPLRAVLDKVGGWPVVDSKWDESKFDWVDQLIKFRNLGNVFNALLLFK